MVFEDGDWMGLLHGSYVTADELGTRLDDRMGRRLCVREAAMSRNTRKGGKRRERQRAREQKRRWV